MKDQLPELKNSIVHIPVDDIKLEAELSIPSGAKGLVIFAHGSGSSRHSSRNKFVAKELNNSSLATLLVDLLSEKEDVNYETRFDISLLTKRLVAITNWATSFDDTKDMSIGYFGASTGATASILATVELGNAVKAIVSRGGRVDMAYDKASDLNTPILLIVGAEDSGVREANEAMYLKLNCKKDLSIVPKATHLFEEPGAIERVAELATVWFKQNLN